MDEQITSVVSPTNEFPRGAIGRPCVSGAMLDVPLAHINQTANFAIDFDFGSAWFLVELTVLYTCGS
jgi:hypothetical protein